MQSYLGGTEQIVFPLGLSCLKSAITGHEASVIDLNLHKEPFKALREHIKAVRPDIIGISLRNIDSTNKRNVVFYYEHLAETVKTIKAHSQGKIIIGGSGFSMFAREIMEDQRDIDLGVFLEGERTFPLLLENLSTPEKVPSVFYRKNGEVVFSGPGGQVDVSYTGIPDRADMSVDKYKTTRDSIGVETKRGCGLNCIYCIYGFLNGKKLRLKDPVRVVDEIENLVNVHGVKNFTFVDSVFNVPQKHAEDICRELAKRALGVQWSAWFSEKNLTRDFVNLALDAGCKNIILSPDGFSDSVLKNLGKNITKRDILDSFDLLRHMDGFEVSYNFFKNPPGQDFSGFLALMRFYLTAKAQMGSRVHFEFNSMRIEPHTQLFDIARREGLVKEGDNLLYPKYYTNPKTRYIESVFNGLLRLKGM
ncbi:MAG: cobalamin-dependent protein [Nitrospirae bacterium]|nr:cobalamin-dependent protein [Nitrospirota bacterium]MBF0536020.1 cobalamin-dependent protein [Nitrospirota bacterium]MBF0617908.1 cobalamin-dependent protein [Nitrospirota bacterium]